MLELKEKKSILTYNFLSVISQSPWGMAMCLVWQLLLMGNGWNWSLFVWGRTVFFGGGGGAGSFLE